MFHNATTGAQGYTGYNPVTNTIVAAYRGSADWQNWIFDLDFFLVAYPNALCTGGCQVDRGFLIVYDSIKLGVMASLEDLAHKYNDRQQVTLLEIDGKALVGLTRHVRPCAGIALQ